MKGVQLDEQPRRAERWREWEQTHTRPHDASQAPAPAHHYPLAAPSSTPSSSASTSAAAPETAAEIKRRLFSPDETSTRMTLRPRLATRHDDGENDCHSHKNDVHSNQRSDSSKWLQQTSTGTSTGPLTSPHQHQRQQLYHLYSTQPAPRTKLLTQPESSALDRAHRTATHEQRQRAEVLRALECMTGLGRRLGGWVVEDSRGGGSQGRKGSKRILGHGGDDGEDYTEDEDEDNEGEDEDDDVASEDEDEETTARRAYHAEFAHAHAEPSPHQESWYDDQEHAREGDEDTLFGGEDRQDTAVR